MRAIGSSSAVVPRRRTRARWFAPAAVGAAFTLLLSACSSSGSSGGSGGLPTVTYGTVPIAGTAPVYVGVQQGLFKKAGINVKIESASAINNIVPGVVSGTYDVGFQSLGGVGSAIAAGLPVKVIGQIYYHVKEQEVMVKAGGPIQKVSDLKGKTIALGALNNNYQAGVIKILQENGLKASDVKFTTLPTDQIASAVESGQVAAGQINEPYIAQNAGKLTTILDGLSPFGSKPANVYAIVNSHWADSHKDLVTKFIQGLARAEALSAKNRSVVDKAVGSFTDISPDLIAKMNMPGFGTDLLEQSFNAQLKLMYSLGFLKKLVTSKDAFYTGVDIQKIANDAVKSS